MQSKDLMLRRGFLRSPMGHEGTQFKDKWGLIQRLPHYFAPLKIPISEEPNDEKELMYSNDIKYKTNNYQLI